LRRQVAEIAALAEQGAAVEIVNADRLRGWIIYARHSDGNPDDGWTPEDFAGWATFQALEARYAE
jgi:hypothetical protein